MAIKYLPPNPNLQQLRHQAKDLLKAHQSGDQDATQRIQASLPRLLNIQPSDIPPEDVSLQEVQHVIAAEYGFENWAAMARYVREITISPDMAHLLEAIEGDDGAAVRSIVDRNPELTATYIKFPSVDRERVIENTPLSYAAHLRVGKPMSDAIKVLTASGADVRRDRDSGMMSKERLHEAMEIDDLKLAASLLEEEPDLANAVFHIRLGGKDSASLKQRAIVYAANQRRTEMVKLLLEAGASEQLGFAFERASLFDNGLPVMQLLVDQGVTLKEDCLMGPCECLMPEIIQFCLANGADVHYRKTDSGETALDLAIATYAMNERRQACIDALIEGGAVYAEEDGAVFDVLRGRLDLLEERYREHSGIVHQHFDIETKCELKGKATFGGHSGGANLKHTTLLHFCAQFNFLKEAEWLIAHGADVNARGIADENGYGDQTPIYHAVTSNGNFCFPMVEFLIENGADLNIRSTIQFPVEKKQIYKDVTPLGYAKAFSNDQNHDPPEDVIALLQKHGAID